MKRAALLPFLLLATFCAGGRATSVSVAGHGALSIDVVPNPIVAKQVTGSDEYDFPFEVIVRETGGRPVDVSRVTARVYALGGIRVATESYDADQIKALGYPAHIPANSEVRYRFTPRHNVPDERLFGGVSAELRAEGQDDTGTPTSSGTTVTVRR